MDRRDALKLMGASIATIAMAGIAPKTHAALLKDREKPKKRLVFYFTATGNSLFIAKQFSDAPLSIPQELKKGTQVYEADEIGFVFPDFTAAAPKIVQEFVQKNTFNAPYIFSIITYGNFCANVAEWWSQFSGKYGITHNYSNTILMVDNYLPVFDMNEQMKIDKKTDENLALLIEDISLQKQYIQVAQQEEGRPQMDPSMLDNMRERQYSVPAQDAMELDKDACTECMTCEKVCPRNNFTLTSSGVSFTGSCEHCLACVHACPQKALTLKSQWPGMPGERNPNARYRHPDISLNEIIRSNKQ